MDVTFDTSDFSFEKPPMVFVTPVGINEVNNTVVAKVGVITKDGFRLACNYHSSSSVGYVDLDVNYMAIEL